MQVVPEDDDGAFAGGFADDQTADGAAAAPKKRRARRTSVEMLPMEGASRGAAMKTARLRKSAAAKTSRRRKCQKWVRKLGKQISAVLNGSSKRLGRALRTLAIVVTGIFGIIGVVAALQDAINSQRDVIFAVVGFLSASAGFNGAKRLNREVLMLYFVLLAFGVSSCTTSISISSVMRVRQAAYCSVLEERRDAKAFDCKFQLALLTINFVLSALLVLVLVLSAWLALRMSEKIQEEEDEEAQAEKDRVKNVMAVMHSRTKSMARRNSKFSAAGSFQNPVI